MDEDLALPLFRRFAYGVGHVLNDLCASMWFSFLLIYLHNVTRFSNKLAGYLLLLGQVADAISTLLVGYESDRSRGCKGYGRRKSWHLLGTLAVVTSFPFIFNKCLKCTLCGEVNGGQPCWVQFVYYAPFVAIFQFGWATTQISHLSLIPELSAFESQRVDLNAIRYGFTVLSNLLVYCVTWILLGQSGNRDLSPSDQPVFTILCFFVIGLGILFSIVFHLGTKERQCEVEKTYSNTPLLNLTSEQNMTWKEWCKEPQFYQVGMLYMMTRLVVNVSQVYMPMFVTESLVLEKHFIAVVPLVCFGSSFVTSLAMRPLNRKLGRKLTYMLGCVLIIASCVSMWYLPVGTNTYKVLILAIILGAGTSTVLIGSLAITSDLIGSNTSCSAFVYGSMSFTDKLSNGVAIALIQYLHPCKEIVCCAACEWYYRLIMGLVVGIFAVVALLVLLSLSPVRIGNLRHMNKRRCRKQLNNFQSAEGEVACDCYACLALPDSNTASASYGALQNDDRLLHSSS